jgi:hypothetical protein
VLCLSVDTNDKKCGEDTVCQIGGCSGDGMCEFRCDEHILSPGITERGYDSKEYDVCWMDCPLCGGMLCYGIFDPFFYQCYTEEKLYQSLCLVREKFNE